VAGVDGQRGEDGEDLSLEDVDQMLRSSSSSEDQSERRMPASARPGTIWSRKMCVLAPPVPRPGPGSSSTVRRVAARRPTGCARRRPPDPPVRPPGPGRTRRAARRRWPGTWPAPAAGPLVLGQVEQAGPEVQARLLPVGEPLVLRTPLSAGSVGGVGSFGSSWHSAVAACLEVGVNSHCVTLHPTPHHYDSRECPVPRRHTRIPRYVTGPKPKRRTELGLLIFGSLLTVSLYVIAELGQPSRRSRPTSARSSGSCSACHWSPTWPTAGWPPGQRRHPPAGRAAQRHRLRHHRPLEPAHAQGQAAGPPSA
jgi:hypothetical protein